MTVGNYVRHCSVRSGGPAAARAVIALVCGAWRVVRSVWCVVHGVWCTVCGAGLVHLSCSPRVPRPLGSLSISHVIPSRIFQTLNSQPWNCNVLRRSRKMTVGNYVRHCSVTSGGPDVARAVLVLVRGVWCVVSGVWCAVCGARYMGWLIRDLGAREPFGVYVKCDALNVSEPTGIPATARGCPCRRVVPRAYLHVITDCIAPSGNRRNLSETCRG